MQQQLTEKQVGWSHVCMAMAIIAVVQASQTCTFKGNRLRAGLITPNK